MTMSLSVQEMHSISVAKSTHLTFTCPMQTDLSDEQLILKYAKGELAAFEELYSRHKGGLFRYCLRQFSNRAIAEECFQDIWMKIINNRIRYQPKALFTTYLYRIAQNHVIDIYRKEKKRASECEYEEEAISSDFLGDSFCVEEKREQNAKVQALRKQIACLPFEQKNTLLLKMDAGLSLEEIANVLDCGKETVKSRLRYATNKLRDLLVEPLGVKTK